jgi:anaerobic selenocysteine-containing dehydrogenase
VLCGETVRSLSNALGCGDRVMTRSSSVESRGKQKIKTLCQACLYSCGIEVHVEGGKIVKIEGMAEHPVNKGRLCPKGANIINWIYSPDRLKFPLKKDHGEWKRISWDEALDTIALKLKEIKEEHGAKAVASLFGMVFFVQGRISKELMQRFWDVYGSPNIFSVDSMCYRVRCAAQAMTFGGRAVPDLEIANTNCLVFWAHNPHASQPPLAWRLTPKNLEDKKIIAIDTRKTLIAEKADIHLQPRPGTDCALALGMIHTIISRDLYDREFVENWTVGFDQLKEHVKDYPPEKVEKITRVPKEKIIEAAEVFARTKPACIHQSWGTLDQTTAGFYTTRAIGILHAITGNYDIPGGYIKHIEPPYRAPRLPDIVKDVPIGIDRFPLHYQVKERFFGEGQGMFLPDAILNEEPYAIKAAIITATNPLRTWPNTKKFGEALRKLDFLVVMDLFMTDTAKLADIVLPAASFLERDEWPHFAFVLGVPYIMLRKKVIEFEECWPDIKFWMELAKRMGFEKYFPWKDVDEYMDYVMEPSGLTVKYLREEAPQGLFWTPVKYKRYETEGFPTPSKKIEIYSETLKEMGHEPLPVHIEPLESPISTPELAKEYPLILTTGSRLLEFLHSEHRNIEKLRKKNPEPFAEINTETALNYHIKDGDKIVVETKRGSIDIKARVTEDILPDVVNISHGWAEADVNILTDEKPANTVGGQPALKSLLCKISKSP